MTQTEYLDEYVTYKLACMSCLEACDVFLFPIIIVNVNNNIMIAKAIVKAMHIIMTTATMIVDVFPAEPESKQVTVYTASMHDGCLNYIIYYSVS